MAEEVLDLTTHDGWKVGIVFQPARSTDLAHRRARQGFFHRCRVRLPSGGRRSGGIGSQRQGHRDLRERQRIARVAVLGECVGNESVVGGIIHRRVEKAIDEQAPELLSSSYFTGTPPAGFQSGR